ncbi:diacylglycerol kinase [Streptomyces sp. ODS05-4]|uniref:diacylglycerol kinase n=1 Tax=Streptomyces sp. ODS05-4 TaxID=2944939 RepID=UPI00210A77B7|nr:diacylglycerol kinase [Streptomyces sp. ODS05-4]
MSAPDQLLVIIDPVARHGDGESVRIAKDVLCARADVRICLPDGPAEFARALERCGSRRPVVVGDDRALLRAVDRLHRGRGLGEGPLSVVPVGAPGAVQLAGGLGVPLGAVAAARAVLEGVARRLDLLVDDSGGVVLRGLRIPAGTRAPLGTPYAPGAPGAVWDTCRSLVRTLVGPPASAGPARPARTHRLRVEADGMLLSDLDAPVEDVTVLSRDGVAEVVVRPRAGAAPIRREASAVTVSGASFRYRADTAQVTGPVWTRTWTLRRSAWALTLPVAAP